MHARVVNALMNGRHLAELVGGADVESASLENPMKAFHYAIALIIMGIALSPAGSYANGQAAQGTRARTDSCAASVNQSATRTDPKSKPPVISVGVSDPDTKLNLPWFLTDIINAVNTHQSARCLLHTLKSGI